MDDPLLDKDVTACFLISAFSKIDRRNYRRRRSIDSIGRNEVNIPQCDEVHTFKKFGRGMPTFKQYVFFVAASRLTRIPYIGKVDDDSIVNVPRHFPREEDFLHWLFSMGVVVPESFDTMFDW